MSNISAAAKQGGEKASSTFAVTCNLLSQFIKDKGRSFGDLRFAMGMPPIAKSDAYQPLMTMNLLPGIDVEATRKEDVADPNTTKPPPAAAAAAADSGEPGKSQLTIFYGGKVLVFDNFSAEKARDLMALAGKGTAPVKNIGFNSPPSAAALETKTFVHAPPPATVQSCPTKTITSDLPIARKASLHRFLEKRKDRINAKAPYLVNQTKDCPASVAANPKEDNQSWLRLKPSQNLEL